jgi:hypothetical protein
MQNVDQDDEQEDTTSSILSRSDGVASSPGDAVIAQGTKRHPGVGTGTTSHLLLLYGAPHQIDLCTPRMMMATLQLVQQAGTSDRPKVAIPEMMKIFQSGADKKSQILMIRHRSEHGNQTNFFPQQQPRSTRRAQKGILTKTKL